LRATDTRMCPLTMPFCADNLFWLSGSDWLFGVPMSGKQESGAQDLRQVLQQLREEHAVYDAQIEEFNRRVYLSIREQAEKKRLQKLKLYTKDRIAWLESR
jgi:hypothetical protein